MIQSTSSFLSLCYKLPNTNVSHRHYLFPLANVLNHSKHRRLINNGFRNRIFSPQPCFEDDHYCQQSHQRHRETYLQVLIVSTVSIEADADVQNCGYHCGSSHPMVSEVPVRPAFGVHRWPSNELANL